jgi:RsiW-degrading membrane proteinase PrsW (M82 family)
MPYHFLIEAPIGLLPVLLFLFVLLHLDSYKLVSLREVLVCLGAGFVLAGVSYFTNTQAIGVLRYDFATYATFAAPVAEESLKAAFIIILFARNRIGFMIDAAIMGFAVGAGFALAENVYYLYVFPGANVGVWMVRGFGTAIMHGGATAVFGVMAQGLSERRATINPLRLVPGLVVAVVVHGLYNYFQNTPLIAAAAMVVTLPLILLVVFAKSEHKIHTWLLTDYESHERLLEEINTGQFEHGEAGRFILDLSKKFDSETVADLFTYIRLHTELVMRAEKISLGRESGQKLEGGHDIHEAFRRLHALEKKIGPAAMLTIWPHLHFSQRELWELNELEGEVRRA